MGRLHTQATSLKCLELAWQGVLENDMDDGQQSRGVARFARDHQGGLALLEAELADGSYTPHDLTEFVITDKDGGQRHLHIPTVRDRIVERSILDAVTPYVDPCLGSTSFAFRAGLGVTDAVQALVALREEGPSWVLRTDVHDRFPSMPVGLARRMFGALVPDEELLVVVDRLLARGFVRAGGGRRIMRGLAQGCSLSPTLANIVLVQLDEALLNDGFAIVRYADDFAVATHSADEAREAARCASAVLDGLGMSLGSDKTEVMSFDQGFCFLGEDFGPRYPPRLENHRVEAPTRRVLYTSLQGGRVRTQAGRLIVESAQNAQILDLPTTHVSRIVCFGSIGVSAGVRSWALDQEVDVVFASRRGSYQGQLLSGSSATRASRLRAQMAFADQPARAIPLAVAIVEAKVRKQIVVLQRFGRRAHAEQVRKAVAQMRQVLQLLDQCVTPAEVMGVEGAARVPTSRVLGRCFRRACVLRHAVANLRATLRIPPSPTCIPCSWVSASVRCTRRGSTRRSECFTRSRNAAQAWAWT